MNKNKKIQGLDGLRAIAILGVTLFHMFSTTFKGGYLGVVLFFVLTGFLLTYTSSERIKNNTFSLKNYYQSRIKRIYPHLILMILTTLGIYFICIKSALHNPKAEIISILTGLNNYYQINQKVDYFTKISSNSPFSHLWFLSIELQFYLIFPFLLMGLHHLQKKKGKAQTIKIFSSVILIFALIMPIKYVFKVNATTLYYGTDTRIFSLLAGMLLAMIYKHKESTNAFKNALICIALLILSYFIFNGQSAIVYLCIIWLVTILSMLIIYFTANSKINLDLQYLDWIGKHSYEIYLWQYPIIFFFQYKHWSNSIAYILEFILLFICVLWSDFILRSIHLYKHKKSLQKLIIVCWCVSLVTQSIGIYACMSIQPIDTSKLESQLKKNKKKLKKHNKQNTTEIKTEEAKNVDYTPSGNSSKVSDQGLVMLGDSVLLSASEELLNIYPDAIIDAEVSRQIYQEQGPYKQYLSEGKVHNTIIMALGTNGTLTSDEVESSLELIGDNHSILWVNNYCPEDSWQDSNNAYLQEIAQSHKNVTIVDWYSLISQHPEWLYEDGVHPNEDGQVQYAQLIQSTLNDLINKQKEIESSAN